MPLAAFPENVSTDQLRAGEIESLMAGMTISGLRNADNQPFEIVLNPDKTTDYTFGAGGQNGPRFHETGRWWAEDNRFCMQVAKFAMGQQACPKIIKTGQAITAVRPTTGETLPWTLTK